MGEERLRRVVELLVVVALDDLNGATKLSGKPSKEVQESRKRIRGKSTNNESNHEEPLDNTSRNTENRIGPQITVYDIKVVLRGARERKPNITT
jgi:hypothetical protein